MIGYEDVGEAAIEVAIVQAMTADLVAACIVDPAKARDLMPIEVHTAHREALARGTPGVRPIYKLTYDVIAQIERAIVRRRPFASEETPEQKAIREGKRKEAIAQMRNPGDEAA